MEAAQARRLEAAARWQAAREAEREARAALAEARRAEWAERARQPVPLGPTLAAGVRIGVVLTVIAVGLGEALSGR